MLPIIILSKSILKVSATEKISAGNNEEDTMTFREAVNSGKFVVTAEVGPPNYGYRDGRKSASYNGKGSSVII